MSKIKLFLSEEEIKNEINEAQEKLKNGIIQEKTIPEYWTRGINKTLSRKKLIILSIFTGLFGVDRFYLGKKISGITKLIFTLLGVMTAILIINFKPWNITDISTLVNMWIFITLEFVVVLGFYITDIAISIKNPRDSEFRSVK